MSFTMELDGSTPSKQAAKVYGSREGVVHINKQEAGVQYAYRLLPFNKATMDLIGVPRPAFEIKKYLMTSATEFRDEAKTKPSYITTISETCLGGTDTVGKHIEMRLAQMLADGNVAGLEKHNALFTNQYRRASSAEDPLGVDEIGIMETWVPALPVDTTLADGVSKPLKDKGVILNVKTTGKNQLFGSNSKKRPVIGLLKEVGSDLISQKGGVDFLITKNASVYSFLARRQNSDIESDAVYLDENLPDAIKAAKDDMNAKEFIRQYDIHLGFISEATQDAEAAPAAEAPAKSPKKASKSATSLTEGLT